jgi:heterogeneous nuclear ribonucleoprotein A1/A3
MKDQNGQSRCFGFVTFTDPQTIDEFMKQRPHTLDGRQIDPKRASMTFQIIIVHHFVSFN